VRHVPVQEPVGHLREHPGRVPRPPEPGPGRSANKGEDQRGVQGAGAAAHVRRGRSGRRQGRESQLERYVGTESDARTAGEEVADGEDDDDADALLRTRIASGRNRFACLRTYMRYQRMRIMRSINVVHVLQPKLHY
jgi:hypothetical protein